MIGQSGQTRSSTGRQATNRHSFRLLGLAVGMVGLLLAPTSAVSAQARPSQLDQAAAAAGPTTCYYTQFCLYEGRNFRPPVHRMSSCTWHSTAYPIGSWKNNQTKGTRARFYDNRLNLLATTRAAYSDNPDSVDLGIHTWYVRPC